MLSSASSPATMWRRGQLSWNATFGRAVPPVPGVDDPRAHDGHAHLEPVALVRAARGAGDREARRERQRENRSLEDALHGTLRKRKAESDPPMSKISAAAPANTSVTSRSSLRSPRREPSSSYTVRSWSSSSAV